MRFVFVPGAGGSARYWSEVVARLQDAGHETDAIRLPSEDPTAGLYEYADLAAARTQPGDVLVSASLGGFTAAMVCDRVAVGGLVLVNAMIPLPGETAGQWWGATGSQPARVAAAEAGGYAVEFDLETYFAHDVPPDRWAALGEDVHEEAGAIFESPCRFTAWPDVPTAVIGGADDRFFPIEFQRRVATERMGRELEVLPGGHLLPMSHPDELTARLLSMCGDVRAVV